MITEKTVSLYYTAKPISYEKLNNEFTNMRCYIMAIGKNRNLSHIGMDAVQQALPSLINIPVVGHLKRADDGSYYLGGHDRQIVIDEKEIVVNDLTVPFGVVPETNNIEFVDVTESNGSISRYLICDIILWTGRYGEILEAKYSDEIYFGHSMEITPANVEPLKEDPNYQDIKSFDFSALCLLGKSDNPDRHTEPCFPSARVEPIKYSIEMDLFKTEFASMMSQLKELAFSINSTEEGGIPKVDEKVGLLQEYGFSEETIDFDISEMSIDELKEKSNDKQEQGSVTETFSATYLQKREALNNALDPVVTKDREGKVVEEVHYWVQDFDDEFVYVERYRWSESDNEVKYGRFRYSFDSENVSATVSGEFEEMFLTWLTKEEKQRIESEKKDSEKKYVDLKESYDALDFEVKSLRDYKSSRMIEDAIAEFEDISDNAEFMALSEKAHTFESVEDFKEKCYALRGRLASVQFSAKKNKTVKLPASDHDSTDDDGYGGILMSKYQKQN